MEPARNVIQFILYSEASHSQWQDTAERSATRPRDLFVCVRCTIALHLCTAGVSKKHLLLIGRVQAPRSDEGDRKSEGVTSARGQSLLCRSTRRLRRWAESGRGPRSPALCVPHKNCRIRLLREKWGTCHRGKGSCRRTGWGSRAARRQEGGGRREEASEKTQGEGQQKGLRSGYKPGILSAASHPMLSVKLLYT